MGGLTQTSTNPNEESHKVEQVIVHSDHNNTKYNNDIALMKVSSPIVFSNCIKPICLASNSSLFYNATLCWTTGWGKTTALNGEVRPDLLELRTPLVGDNECRCQYKDEF
ncbi:transmembrane protease serine 3 [Genypterus blacodes]|uniref:transmembrane protease serine 3 n=1 Tax=Genypterus blacodes TaxID=154954 RepID=UPI003F769355